MIKNFYAFSLPEFLFVIALFILLIGIGLPSYKKLIAQNQANATMIQLYRAIQFARSEAIKHRCMVTLCPTRDDYHCSNDHDWNQGYLAFIDPQARGTISDTKQIIKVFHPITLKGKLFWKGFPNKNMLQMTPLGFTNYQNGTFRYSLEEGNTHIEKALFIIQSGRIRLERGQVGKGSSTNL